MFEDRLKQVTLPGTGGTVSFLYDPFGRRIQKAFTQNGTTTTTNYVYDGESEVETLNQNGSAIARYAQGQDIDEVLGGWRTLYLVRIDAAHDHHTTRHTGLQLKIVWVPHRCGV